MGEGPNDQGLSRHHIMNGVEASLRRLQVDFIDLYQVHWPDEETPLDETLEALNDLVRSGKVRYIGCSNYPAWLLTKSLWISDARGIVVRAAIGDDQCRRFPRLGLPRRQRSDALRQRGRSVQRRNHDRKGVVCQDAVGQRRRGYSWHLGGGPVWLRFLAMI